MPSLRQRLAERGLAPSRARGQNFLRSPDIAERIVRTLELEPTDAAVEIGPGMADLTRALAPQVRRLIALEIDRGLVRLLAEEDLGSHVEVRHADAMKADLGGLARELGAPAVLVGNLPYSISGRFLGNLLGPRNSYRRWGFMLQAEVGDRLLAEPGDRDYGPLAVWARLWTRARKVLALGPDAFVPRPKVKSSFLVFDPAPDPPAIRDLKVLRLVVRTAFQHRRKTLRAALRSQLPGSEAAIERCGIDGGLRGEAISEFDFVRLADALADVETNG